MYSLTDLALPAPRSIPTEGVLEEVRRRTFTRCARLGVIRDDRMTPRQFAATKCELLSALTYPDASLDALALCTDFFVYLFFVDDCAEEDESFGKRPHRLQRYFEQHIAILRSGAPAGVADPAGRLLVSIRARLTERASAHWLERFANGMSDYLLRGTLEGARHWTAGTVPSFDDFLEQRAWDSAVQCVQDLIEVAGGGELSAAVLGRADWSALQRHCTNVVAFTNDLVSYSKEARSHENPKNLVHVIATHEKRTVTNAIGRVIEIVNQEVASFEALAAQLPSFETAMDKNVARYLDSQRAWMVGNLTWSLAAGRYMDPQSPFVELRKPSASLSERRYDIAG